ncbi:DCC1-like thiol-disulfide oxidoreductase family protein [Aliarcobacter lanthieri]|uniref:DCC1-like thiol-disulfide oxidoreductase family protein n=1 Tax=Aliarcobacter lanthieri TaxID=1355374 RepID=UPI003AA98155
MKQISLYYDDECPFCKEYSKYIELRKKYDVQVLNARDSIETIKTFREKGFDINYGMIVELDGDIYQGASAAKLLDKCISKDKFIDKVISFFVKLPGFKQVIYPLVLVVRRIVLKVSGKNVDINY